MFWILGADALVHAAGRLSASAPTSWITGQLQHKAWTGFAFYDLIFPLFVFIVGVSVVFSLGRAAQEQSRSTMVKRILFRGAVLFLLGILYNGGLTQPWPEVRLVGVLQRIAIAYTATALLFTFCRTRALVVVAALLLTGYWAVLTYVPIRDIQLAPASLVARLGTAQPTMAEVENAFAATTERTVGRFEPGLNVTNHLDFQYLPGRRYDVYYDPEGLLSMLPAIATCLLGVFAGELLRRTDWPGSRKALLLAVVGVAAIALGWAWGQPFPVIKKLWTSSYVLVAGGWSFLLLAAFYYIIDVRQWRSWSLPFVWIGMNPITLYLASAFIDFRGLARRFVGGSVEAWLNTHVAAGAGALLVTLVGLSFIFLLAHFLYRRRIFLKV
jgi:predicted acyltransferase